MTQELYSTKTFYAKALTGKELCNAFKKIKPEEWKSVGITPTKECMLGQAKVSFYEVNYKFGKVSFAIEDSSRFSTIYFLSGRTRNINRVASKLSKLFRLDDLGGFEEITVPYNLYNKK